MKDPAETKRRIQQAALRLFGEKGVGETSVRDLANAAGMAEGTLYRHYTSKDELVADLFVTNYAAFAHRLAALQAPLKDTRTRLGAIVGELFRFHDADPALFRFLLIVQHQALPRVADGDDNPVSVLHRLVAEAHSAGEIGVTDAALGTAMILGMMLQPASALLYGRLQPPLAQYAPAVAASCWRALDPRDGDCHE